MARRCELTGKEPQFGHNVSHSNRKTNRRFDPNLQKITFYSDALRGRVGLRVSTRVLRTVQKHGGLDAFLLATDDGRELTPARHAGWQLSRDPSGRLRQLPEHPAADYFFFVA
jgi:large subunit ribosomal protein L28